MALEKMEIEVDDSLVHEVMRKYHLHGARDAVNLALRNLLSESEGSDSSLDAGEWDEFSDLSALEPHRHSESA